MRFMIMGLAPQETEAGPPPKPEAFVAMQQYHEEAVKAGILLAAEGLTPTSKAVRVNVDGDRRTVTDGPFAEAKEVVAGFSIIKVNSMKEAIEWVRGVPNFFPGGRAVVEIRKLMDIEDFGESFTPNPEVAKVKFQ